MSGGARGEEWCAQSPADRIDPSAGLSSLEPPIRALALRSSTLLRARLEMAGAREKNVIM